MSKPITTIVTIPSMIGEADWKNLAEKSEVIYIERSHVSLDELLEMIANSHYLMLNRDVVDTLNEQFYRRIVELKLPLRAISVDITGMSWANPASAKKYGLNLMNTPDYSTVSVAEFSLAVLLELVKKLNLVWRDRLTGREMKPRQNGVLFGKTVGIVGLGHIGTKLTELLGGFGVKIIAWDRNEKHLPHVKQLPLGEVLAQSDYLSIHLRETPETTSLFDAKLLAQAKPGQIIINCADNEEGNALANLNAMHDALRAGKLGGYAGSSETMGRHPIADLESVVSFPPQAWFTDYSLQLLREIWVGNVLSAIDGKPRNLTD